MKILSNCWILLLILPLTLLAGEDKYPKSVFTIGAGFNSFSSSDPEQRGRNGGNYGRIEILQKIRIPVGISASLAYDLCPVCDGTGGEYVAAYSIVAQFVPFRYPFQFLTGLGYATGNNPKKDGSEGDFGGLNFPLIARLLYSFRTSNTHFAIGAEFSLDLNNTNNVLAVGLPIQWGVW